MEKTTNYQLNQWDANDKVQRVDFNADNTKIDAALQANANAIAAEVSARISAVQAEASARAAAVQAARDACPLVVLRSVTLSAATSRYALSLTGFDWDAYGEIIIYLFLKGVTNVKVLLNGLTGTSYYYDHRAGGPTEQFVQLSNSGSAVCRLLRSSRGFQAEWNDNSNWPDPRYIYFCAEYTPRSDFKTMDLVGDMAAGSRFTILGIRG